MKASKAEEDLLNHLWFLKKAYMKDLLDQYPEPKPATTTLATLLKRLKDKKFVDYSVSGKSREYFPLITKEAYFSKHFNGLIQNFFNNSKTQFASYFTKETDLSKKELEDLKAMIEDQLKSK